MVSAVLSIALALSTVVTAVIVPVKQIRPSSPQRRSLHTRDLDLSTVNDLLYMANITVGQHTYVIQMDTGSSDLWLKGETSPLPNSVQTSIQSNISYGMGWASGKISTADTEFATIKVSKQAYLDVDQVQNPALGYGANGILGLGFTSLSTIDKEMNKTGSSAGRSLLYNLFEDNPSEPNFIAFAFQRSTEQGDEVEGSFAIGEYEPTYKAVANTQKIPTWPVSNPNRWNVIVEAIVVGDNITMPTTKVPDVPSNRAVILLDSGTSWTYAPPEIVQAIYGGVSGAHYDSTLGQWVMPCNAEIDMAFQIGGRTFPLHPLDMVVPNLNNPSTCVGSFIPQPLSVGLGQFDWLVGDNFLRSVYSVYDFGDFDSNNQMGNPYVQLLSLVDPNKASAEFVKQRGGTAKTGISYPVSNEAAAAADSTSVVLSAEVATSIAQIGKFFPAILGLVALNALVLLALAILGIVLLCRKRKTRRARKHESHLRTHLGRLTPMPMDSRRSSVMDESLHDPAHTYQPVSMAMTEDTLFTPPTAGFKKDGSRPKSYAPTINSIHSMKQRQGPPSPEDALFDPPPSPGFRQFEEGSSSRPASSMMPPSILVMPSNSSYQRLGQPNEPQDEPFVPPRPAFALRPAPASRGDRPMSVGILPSQSAHGYPPHSQQAQQAMPIHMQPPSEELEQDISLTSPRPAFYAEGSGTLRPGMPRGGDRPQSVA